MNRIKEQSSGARGGWLSRLAAWSVMAVALAAPWQVAQAQQNLGLMACGEGNIGNCTANDLKDIRVTASPGFQSCEIGTWVEVDSVTISARTQGTLYDIGAWFLSDQPNMCQVWATSTNVGGFTDQESEANSCGDLSKATGTQTFTKVMVECRPDGEGRLAFPTIVYWNQNKQTAACSAAPGTASKCKTMSTSGTEGVTFTGKITIKKIAAGGEAIAFPFTLPDPAGPVAGTINGGGQVVKTGLPTGATYVITEGALPANWQFNGATCTSTAGGQWTNVGQSVTVPLSNTHYDVTCEFVNTPIPVTGQVILSKTLTANDPGVFTYTLTGTSGVTSGGSGDKLTATGVAAGTAVTFTETAQSPAVAGNYATTWACTGTGVSASGTGTSGSFTMPNPAVGVSCSFNNQRKQQRLYVNKVLTDASANPGKFDLMISGLTAPVASGVGTYTDTEGTLIDVGSTVTVSEAAATGAPALANFASRLTCEGATPSTNTGTSAQITVPDADVHCTFTNVRKQATLSVAKAWASGFKAGDKATVTTTDFTHNPTSGQSTAGTGTTGAGVTVYAGEVGHLTETFAVGAKTDYTQTYACNNSVFVDVEGQITIGSTDADKTIICTLTNTRKPSSMTITKTSSVTGQVAAGSTLTYKVVVSNTGEIALNGVPVTDPVPAGVASQTWSCAGTQGGATCNLANGTGAVAGTVDLPAGGVVTYTIEAQLSPSLEGPVINVATVTPPDGTTCTSSCSATVTNEPGPPAPKAVTAIPTTSPEGLAALALMMVGVAGWAARRRRLRR